MADVELRLSYGPLTFEGRGPQDWVTEQFKLVTDLFPLANGTVQAVGATNGRVGEAEVTSETRDDDGAANLESKPKADRWVRHNNLSVRQLHLVYHLGRDGVELIAGDVPGETDGEKVISVYLLTGIRALLEGGEPMFADDEARAKCLELGCFKPKRHPENVKAAGNLLAGSKEHGWTLTAPGLAEAAVIVKQLAP